MTSEASQFSKPLVDPNKRNDPNFVHPPKPVYGDSFPLLKKDPEEFSTYSENVYADALGEENADFVMEVRAKLRGAWRESSIFSQEMSSKERLPGYWSSMYWDRGNQLLDEKDRIEQEFGKVKSEPVFPQPNWDEIHSVRDLFSQAKDQVDILWREEVGEDFFKLTDEWAQGEGISEDVKNTLHDHDRVQTIFELNYYGALEDLNKINPQAWRTLLALSSEREAFYINTVRRWIRENLDNKGLAEKFGEIGMNADEIRIMLDLSQINGKMFDLGYFRQAKGAENAGDPVKAGELVKYDKPTIVSPQRSDTYDRVYPRGDGKLLSDAEVFTHEMKSIVFWFRTMAESIDEKLKTGVLPKDRDYNQLADRLRLLADAHELKGGNPEELAKKWEEVESNLVSLLETRCPIFVYHTREQGLGGTRLIDVELRVNYRTNESRELEKGFPNLIEHVKELNTKNGLILDFPLFIITNQPSAYGPNTWWRTRGQEMKGKLNVTHPEPCEAVARKSELPLLRVMFPDKNIDEGEYIRAAFEETMGHEFAHLVAPADIELIKARIGSGNADVKIVEELKAETVKMLLLDLDTIKEPQLELIAFAKLGVCLDALKNKSSTKGSDGERYYYPALAIIDKLLEKNLLTRKDDGTYEIGDFKEIIKEVGSLGQDLLDNYYFNVNCNSATDIPWRANEIRGMKTKPNVALFLTDLNERSAVKS